MKKIYFAFLLCLFTIIKVQAQSDSTTTKSDDEKVYTKAEIDATFPGGNAAWNKYINNIIQDEKDKFIEADYGTCVVKFIVDKTGRVSDVKATTMKGTKLAELAVKAIEQGPNWIPAQQNVRYVTSYCLQPVTFTNPDQ
jgi:protein TonB